MRTSSPGSNPAERSAAITPISSQALLDVGERLQVGEIVPGDEHLDAASLDAERSLLLRTT